MWGEGDINGSPYIGDDKGPILVSHSVCVVSSEFSDWQKDNDWKQTMPKGGCLLIEFNRWVPMMCICYENPDIGKPDIQKPNRLKHFF